MASRPSWGMRAIGIGAAIDAVNELRYGYGEKSAWIVGVGANYGIYVELGTRKMAAQPYLFPAAQHVVRTRLPLIEREARLRPRPIPYIIAQTALEIEGLAKRNAPVDTGFLRSSIEAFPAKALR